MPVSITTEGRKVMSVARQTIRVNAVRVPKRIWDSMSDRTKRINPALRAMVVRIIGRTTWGKVAIEASRLSRRCLAVSL